MRLIPLILLLCCQASQAGDYDSLNRQIEDSRINRRLNDIEETQDRLARNQQTKAVAVDPCTYIRIRGQSWTYKGTVYPLHIRTCPGDKFYQEVIDK